MWGAGVRSLLLVTSVLGVQGQNVQTQNETGSNGKENDLTNSIPETIWCKPCACGLANRMERIVGGWATHVNEYPWVLALTINGKFYCGATLINDLYALTAAHCVQRVKKDKLKVVVAEHNKAQMDESVVEVLGVSKIKVHMDFDKSIKFNNDIAIIRFDRRLKFREAVSPICLPYPEENFDNALGKVTGWGHTKEGGPASMELLETNIAVLPNSDCHNKPGYGPDKVNENMMCAGLMEGGRDSCQGDSGGSMIVENWQGRMFQAGIVSWGVGCARPNRPGVYTRVNQYLSWIIQHTADACFCF